MAGFLTTLGVIALIAIVGVIVYLVYKKLPTENEEKPQNDVVSKIAKGGTTPPSQWMFEILHPVDGEVLQRGIVPGLVDDEVFVIGRDDKEKTSKADFKIKAKDHISREHLQVSLKGNNYYVKDISRYGTFHNGKRLEEKAIQNGMVLNLADDIVYLRFKSYRDYNVVERSEEVEEYVEEQVFYKPKK